MNDSTGWAPLDETVTGIVVDGFLVATAAYVDEAGATPCVMLQLTRDATPDLHGWICEAVTMDLETARDLANRLAQAATPGAAVEFGSTQ